MDTSCPQCKKDLAKKLLSFGTAKGGIKGFFSRPTHLVCPFCKAAIVPNTNPLESKLALGVVAPVFIIGPFVFVFKNFWPVILSVVLTIGYVAWFYYYSKNKLRNWPRWRKVNV